MCGLCLPHCPTYRKMQTENESPRGRISLMRALTTGELTLTDKLQSHLDNCLLCRACEAACPSKVQYGKMMGASRALMAQQKPQPPSKKISLGQLVTNKQQRRRVGQLAWLAEHSGLRTLGRGLGLTKAAGLQRLEQLAPITTRPKRWPSYIPTTAKNNQGDVALFTGCFSDLFDRQTLEASITLLNHVGYGVHIPKAQNCCGALHYHKGDSETANTLAEQNDQAFAELDIIAIVNASSGCGSHLKTRQSNVVDICDFLAKAEWPDQTQFSALPKCIAVHEPCSLRNVLKAAQHPYELLKKIPQTKIVALPNNQYCCGGAGSYMVDHPEMADSLRADKLTALKQVEPDILVTSNIGCAMQIGAGIRMEKQTIEILHPITLLARQLESTE